MSPYLLASVLAQTVTAVPAPAAAQLATSVQEAGVPGSVALIPTDWASPTYDAAAARMTARRLVAEEQQAKSSTLSTHSGALRASKVDTFAAQFEAAAVPHCLGRNGLKHQPPKIGPVILGGLFAIPFLVVAAARGKCK